MVLWSIWCTYLVIVLDCSHHHDINLYVLYKIQLRFSMLFFPLSKLDGTFKCWTEEARERSLEECLVSFLYFHYWQKVFHCLFLRKLSDIDASGLLVRQAAVQNGQFLTSWEWDSKVNFLTDWTFKWRSFKSITTAVLVLFCGRSNWLENIKTTALGQEDVKLLSFFTDLTFKLRACYG